MKINNINNYTNFKNNFKPMKKEAEINNAKKYDAIEIKNKNIKETEDFNINSIKKNTVLKIKEDASAEKIEQIKESIKNNTYNIDVDEIVNRMLR